MPESKPGAAIASPMNFCELEGFLVNGDIRLPVDSIDHDEAGLPALGCNRLRCSACQAMVRSVPHVAPKGIAQALNRPDLYELADLTTAPQLEPRKGDRFYLCRCDHHAMSSKFAPLGAPNPDPFYDVVKPWRCDGHPVAELPRTIDGVEVTPKNVEDVTRQSLHGRMPPDAAPQDKIDGKWAGRLHARLARSPWQDAVVSAALSCLEDLDFEARTRALYFFLCRKLPAGAQRAVELLDGDRTLFADVPDLATGALDKNQTLEHTLWLLARPLVAQPGRAREVAQQDAQTPGRASYPLYAALAQGDPEWVAAHADAIADANPGAVALLVKAVTHLFPERVPNKPVLERLRAKAASGAK